MLEKFIYKPIPIINVYLLIINYPELSINLHNIAYNLSAGSFSI